MQNSYTELPNLVIRSASGIDFTYRDTGDHSSTTAPIVLFQHFRGNLDYWDPALIDGLARTRRVITFDNAGVGGSTGVPADSIEQMARDAIDFITALRLGRVDLLGFSIGSFVAQEVTLRRPALVRRLVLASSAPRGAAGMHGWAPEVIGAIGNPDTSAEEYLGVFFTGSQRSLQAGQETLGRIFGGRTQDRDATTDWATREAQYEAVCAWGVPDHGALERLVAIRTPVFVANGDSDPMILPQFSYLLAGLIPQARLKIYPDAAHGFLFQYHDEFATDVADFLS